MRFKVHNRFSGSVSEQIRLFENKNSPESEFSVEFFSEYDSSDFDTLSTIPLISAADKKKYRDFLENNTARITKVIINIHITDQELPYIFLGDCLSILAHIEILKITCCSEDDETFNTLKDLGLALQRLANLKTLVTLWLGVSNLVAKSRVEVDEFISFMQSCVNVTDVLLDAVYLDKSYAIDAMINTISQYHHLKKASVRVHNCQLSTLGKLFINKSIEKLKIELTGLQAFSYTKSEDGYTRVYLSAKEEIEVFARSLAICTNLKKLKLYLGELTYNNYYVNGSDDTDMDWSLDAFKPISHNKTLESLLFHFPGEPTEEECASFIKNFENSSLLNLELVCDENNLALAKSITDENRRLAGELQEYKKVIYNPQKFKDSFFPSISPGYLAELDRRVARVDLRIAHFNYQRAEVEQQLAALKQEPFVSLCLYKYFCESLKVPQFSRLSNNTIMNIVSYLSQRDLSQVLQVAKGGTLGYIREKFNQGLRASYSECHERDSEGDDVNSQDPKRLRLS